MILKMNLEETLEHAESIHNLVTTRLLSVLDGFVDPQRSAQWIRATYCLDQY